MYISPDGDNSAAISLIPNFYTTLIPLYCAFDLFQQNFLTLPLFLRFSHFSFLLSNSDLAVHHVLSSLSFTIFVSSHPSLVLPMHDLLISIMKKLNK